MENSYESLGVECYDGWKDIINPIFEYIKDYNKDKPESEQIIIDQVKESFGGLVFKVQNAPDKLKEMIRNAEEKSYETCEICGSKSEVGTLYISGWMYTRCRNCAQELVNRRYSTGKFKTENGIEFLNPNI